MWNFLNITHRSCAAAYRESWDASRKILLVRAGGKSNRPARISIMCPNRCFDVGPFLTPLTGCTCDPSLSSNSLTKCHPSTAWYWVAGWSPGAGGPPPKS